MRSAGRLKWVLKIASSPDGFIVNSIDSMNPRTARTLNYTLRAQMIKFHGTKIEIGENRSTKKEVYRITEKGEAKWLELNQQ